MTETKVDLQPPENCGKHTKREKPHWWSTADFPHRKMWCNGRKSKDK